MSILRKAISSGLLVLVGASLVTINAQAHQEHGQGEGKKGKMPTYAEFDLNGDGKMVEQEFNEAHAKRMSDMAAEGRKMKHAGKMCTFSNIDTNEDDVISEQEFATHQAEQRAEKHKKS